MTVVINRLLDVEGKNFSANFLRSSHYTQVLEFSFNVSGVFE